MSADRQLAAAFESIRGDRDSSGVSADRDGNVEERLEDIRDNVAASTNFGIFTSHYPAAEPASAASANTFGSWVEIFADVGITKTLVGVFVAWGGGLVAEQAAEIEIGEGAAASESTVARVALETAATDTGFLTFVVLRQLTDNARLSVRVRDEDTGANTFKVIAFVGDR